MRVLLRYHYFQPLDDRPRFSGAVDGKDVPAFTLIYSGAIPTEEQESTEEILERLLLRHGAQLRPHSRDRRPIGSGDVLDLASRGLWQVMPTGFRALRGDQMPVGAVN